MKVEEQNVATFNVGRKETAVAQIQASAKAFEILSSGLYSDAEFAIVREIAANAWDSHKAAGYPDKPFRVQIPTSLDPRFCIRDYGTSMTHEFMMTRVNTYFDSTKNDNNDEIGGFGLGIKSVFSYTTSFMIACFLGGKRRVYVYQIGETGLPEISLMAESDTTEADGVEVSIPVKEADYGKFVTAVKKTFAFYDVKPEVTGVDLNIPEFHKAVEGTNWFVCRDHDVFNREVYVEMGGIAYPVESSIHDLSFYGRSQTLFIKAQIGDIDITPNREQVKMTPKTTKFIKDTIKTVGQEIQDVIQKAVNDSNFQSYWDMIEFANSFNSDMIRKLGYDRSRLTYNKKIFVNNDFTVRVMAKPQPVDINDPSQGMTNPTITDDMVAGIVHFGFWELKSTRYGDGAPRIKREENSWRSTSFTSFDRFTRPKPIVVMERKLNAHTGRWMRAENKQRITVITVEDGTAADVVTKVKAILQDFTEVHNAADLTYEKQIPGKHNAERKFYIYSTSTWDAVSRKEIEYSSLPATMYYALTDGRQRGQLFGKDVDFKNEGKFLTVAKEWLGGQIYYLTEALIAKITKNRPDIELKLIGPELEGMLEDKVRTASLTYFDQNMDSIYHPFCKVASHWRAVSALDFWGKKFGFTDIEDAKKSLAKHNPDQGLERMCKAITGKMITDLFVEYGLSVQTISCPNLDKLRQTIPYFYAFVDCYQAPEVLEHIATQMGWTIDGLVKDDDDDY